MKPKKVPIRKCVATQTQLPKKELFRIVRTPEGEVKVDLTGKMNGRGAYLAKTIEAVMLAKKKNVLERHLEVKINEEIYQELIEIINNEQK
ncbi:MAG: YlxR family protein [Bacilli bacterium]|nr:YlxR family protein [Bacilli bacterium]